MIYKHIIGDLDQDAPARDCIAVGQVDDTVFINTGTFAEKHDGSFEFKANGPQIKVDLDDLLSALGYERNE